MSDEWPRYLSKRATPPILGLVMLLGGIIVFFLALIAVLVPLFNDPWGLLVSIVLTLGLLFFVVGGIELNYWATKYWDTHKDEKEEEG